LGKNKNYNKENRSVYSNLKMLLNHLITQTIEKNKAAIETEMLAISLEDPE